MQRRGYLAGMAAGGAGLLAGCSAVTGLLETEDYDIGMTRMDFEPETYEVAVGETVVWNNTSEARHTVTAYEGTLPEGAAYWATGGYDSEAAARDAWEDGAGIIETRETFEHTFEVPGTVEYVCLPHEVGGMVGTIVVED